MLDLTVISFVILAIYFVLTIAYEKTDQWMFKRRNRKAQIKALTELGKF